VALLIDIISITGCAIEDTMKTYDVETGADFLATYDKDSGSLYQYALMWSTNDGFGCFDGCYPDVMKSSTYYEVYTGSNRLNVIFNYVKSQTIANKVFNIQYVFDYLDSNNLSYSYFKEDSNPYGDEAYFIGIN
jgi:hypothetical protein